MIVPNKLLSYYLDFLVTINTVTEINIAVMELNKKESIIIITDSI